MKRWLAAIPVVALLLFAVLALSQLLSPKKGDFERISRVAPDRLFETLEGGALTFAPPPGDQSVVVNLFASWCAPCEAEHPQLVALANAFPGRVYGVLYKDTEANGEDFLNRMGNPFTEVALDPDGMPLLEAWLDRSHPEWRELATPPDSPTGPMGRAEALEVLGLTEGATAEEIRSAHRRLMRRAHPDQGGSDWLASRLNEARDILLG